MKSWCCVSLFVFLILLLFSQVIENLDTLSSLQSLFLGTNKIATLQSLEGLHSLTVLSIQVFTDSLPHLWEWFQEYNWNMWMAILGNHFVYLCYLQSNRITKIEGLQNLVNLKELYLSHNGIEVIEGLENNVSYRNSSACFWKDWTAHQFANGANTYNKVGSVHSKPFVFPHRKSSQPWTSQPIEWGKLKTSAIWQTCRSSGYG